MARAAPKAAAAALGLAATLVMAWEGYRPTPYQDTVGVLTVCYGHAYAEQRRYSPAECKALLENDLAEAYGHVRRCIHVPLTDNEAASLTSAVYNIGPSVVCGSTLQKLANQGASPKVWCRELLRWDRAAGRRVLGLTKRRRAEMEMCLGEESNQ